MSLRDRYLILEICNFLARNRPIESRIQITNKMRILKVSHVVVLVIPSKVNSSAKVPQPVRGCGGSRPLHVSIVHSIGSCHVSKPPSLYDRFNSRADVSYSPFQISNMTMVLNICGNAGPNRGKGRHKPHFKCLVTSRQKW